MENAEDHEIAICVGRSPHASGVADLVRGHIEARLDEVATEVEIEHWEPRPVRGAVGAAFVTSIGFATLSRSALTVVSSALSGLAVALEGSADAELITIEVDGRVVPLHEVTPEMIEEWLPRTGGSAARPGSSNARVRPVS